MYEIRKFLNWRLTVVTYDEPFSASDLMSVVETLGIPGQGEGRHLALLIDLRRVAVSGVSANDSRQLISLRRKRMPDLLAEPAAFLIRGDQDFGNIRMHNLWSEALGFRNEEDTLITVDVHEALSWLSRRTNQPDLPKAMLRNLQRER